MLSIVVPWYNRNELELAMPSLIKNVERLEAEIIIINLGGNKKSLEKQLGLYIDKVKVITISNISFFNKPLAQNIGAYHAKYDYIFFCDCDIILPDDCLNNLLNTLKATSKTFGTLATVTETKLNARKANNITMFGYELRLKIADGTEVVIIDNEEDSSNGTRKAPGLLMLRKSDFELINGYNSELDGWGWEDQDMICRLTLKAKLKRILLGNAQHISHDDETRMQGYLNYENRWESRDKMFRRALANYDNDMFNGSYINDINNYHQLILTS